MAVNYNELFNFLYSTRIPESLKDEVLNTIELPIQESIELPSYIHECVNFLDTLAYSNMSEELTNELIDSVFEGCSEEFMEEVLEAYIQIKACEYITEGAAPVGLTGIAKENKAREEASKRAKARREAVGKAVDTFKSKAAEVGSKAKEGVKAAVGKVKDWYKKTTQDRPIGLAKINNFKAQSKPATEQPKSEPSKLKTIDPAKKREFISRLLTKNQPEVSDEQAAKATSTSINKHTNKVMAGIRNSIEQYKKQASNSNAQEAPAQAPEKKDTDSSKQLSFMTNKGNISKNYLKSVDKLNKAADEKAKKEAEKLAKKQAEEAKKNESKQQPPKGSDKVVSQATEPKKNKPKPSKAMDKVVNDTISAEDKNEGNKPKPSTTVEPSKPASNSNTATATKTETEVAPAKTKTKALSSEKQKRHDFLLKRKGELEAQIADYEKFPDYGNAYDLKKMKENLKDIEQRLAKEFK